MELTVENSRFKRGSLVVGAAMVLALLASLLFTRTDRAAGLVPGDQNFGTSQTYTPSADAFRLLVVARGADGQDTPSVTGGEGAQVTATIDVEPLVPLQIFINEGGAPGGRARAASSARPARPAAALRVSGEPGHRWSSQAAAAARAVTDSSSAVLGAGGSGGQGPRTAARGYVLRGGDGAAAARSPR